MQRDNFFYLLAGLVILLLATPLALERPDAAARITMELAITITLILGVWSLSGSR